MSNLENDLKHAFALLDLSNFEWLDEEEAKKPFKTTKKGYMQVPLNKETFEGMKAATVFTGHWATQGRQVMKKPRLFRIEVFMYEVGFNKPIQAVARMKKPDTVHTLWKAIGEASRFIMSENKNTEWAVDRCKAVVKV